MMCLSKLFVVLILAVFANCQLNGRAECKEVKPPNFLVIVADDQSPFDLRLYNPNSVLDTPAIERLAASGMVFDAAYHMGSFSGAVCLPSRTMIMTGRSLWRLPNAPEGKLLCPPDIDQYTLPAVFNRAGYSTMRTCKIGNSYEPANVQFQVRHEATKRGTTSDTGSPWHGDRVIDYLEARASQGDTRPFMIYLGFSHPHDPRDGPPDLLAKYGATNHTHSQSPPTASGRHPQLPINYLPSHPFDMTHANVRDEVAVSGVWFRRDENTVRNEIGRQFACSEYIDQQIGRVLQLLESLGELENTYVIYTSDHGMAIGRHGLMGKQNLYEHSWRVPFVVAGPGIPAGNRVDGNIYLLDLLATLCELADIPVPASSEGRSFKSVLMGERVNMREELYGVYSGGSLPGIRCVKRGRWKLIRYNSPDRQVYETQLFDLVSNPDELLEEHREVHVQQLTGNQPAKLQRNLAGDPNYSEELTLMEDLLREQMHQWGDPHLK